MNNNDNSIFKNKDVDSNYSVDNEIIVYHPNSTFSLDVRVEKETVWLTQPQIAELFGTKRPAITKHLSNIFKSGELDENSVCSILEHTATDGKITGLNFIIWMQFCRLVIELTVSMLPSSVSGRIRC